MFNLHNLYKPEEFFEDMKGVFIVLDGVADEPVQSLGMITPLQAAKTPHLDALATGGRVDHCVVVREGVAPQSSSALLSLLGYEPDAAERGPLEAAGAGLKISHGDLVFRTNFATVEGISNLALLDRRAGRTLSTKEAQILADAINKNVKLHYPFSFHPTLHHRGVLVFRGGFSDNITNVDPDYGKGVVSSGGKVRFSQPLDDDDEARVASELVNSFVRQSHEILDKHPLNISRAKRGLYSANFVLCRDPGNEPPQLKKLKGKWMGLVYTPLEIGIARAAKMTPYTFDYPPMKGIDVYANLYVGLNKAIKRSVRMLKKYHDKYDYFLIHIKETDIPGHDNKPLEKISMIELLDRKLFAFLNTFLKKHPAQLIVTADHTTSCRLKAHTDKPVPVLHYTGEKQKDQQRFTEEQGMRGKKLIGRKLLEKTFFA